MSYRDQLYSAYVSTHASRIYGSPTIQSIEAQFPVWRAYFGRFLPPRGEARILELGCGNGGFVHFLQRAGYASAEGVDISEEQVEVSRKLGVAKITYCDLRTYLAEKRNEFDVIFARDVLEHFCKDEVLSIFSAVHTALKPSGVFVVQVPNGESPLSGRIRYGDFSHELSFTRSSLGQVFSVAGYGTVEYHPAGPVPRGVKSVIRLCLWKAIESAIRLYLLVETGTSAGIFTQNLIAAGFKDTVTNR